MCSALRLSSNTWCDFTVFKVLTLCSPFYSELLPKSFDQEKPFRTCLWCRSQLSLQPKKDHPCIYQHKWGTPSLFNQECYLYFAGTYLRREIWVTDRCLLRKLVFLFGDAIEENEDVLFDGNYKWLCLGGDHFFLPIMEQKFPLLYLQSMSLPQYMDWDLVRAQ